ncbi:hypothetical protein O181_015263 [Austropuccinia psidii MF-1]|uniref:Uncharacterized protein n=1 Tax=Austropuccinia psidii MF-1 TaxID=1389203 RepID=A0A9Q3C255_9BASI|nr:hypothetical protein [Austropuccinia psidii MF-1]
MLSEAHKKDDTPVEAAQASTSNNPPPKVPKKDNKAPKINWKGKKKAKVKQKSKWNKTYPQNYSKERKDSNGQFVQYGKNFDGIQKQGGGKNESKFAK